MREATPLHTPVIPAQAGIQAEFRLRGKRRRKADRSGSRLSPGRRVEQFWLRSVIRSGIDLGTWMKGVPAEPIGGAAGQARQPFRGIFNQDQRLFLDSPRLVVQVSQGNAPIPRSDSRQAKLKRSSLIGPAAHSLASCDNHQCLSRHSVIDYHPPG